LPAIQINVYTPDKGQDSPSASQAIPLFSLLREID
jgi:hypothetical protein